MVKEKILLDSVEYALPYFFDDPNDNSEYRSRVREKFAEVLRIVRSVDIDSYQSFILFDAVRNALCYLVEDPNDRYDDKRMEVRRQLVTAKNLMKDNINIIKNRREPWIQQINQ